jgi:uncharacterized protein DUF1707/cell wall-active antibiotic response 4TMS protein YvqF
MANEPVRSVTSLELVRERTIQALCNHFANDRLTTEQVDERLERAQKAQSRAELDTLLADMPVTDLTKPQEHALGYEIAQPSEVLAEARVFAFMGEVRRRGVWSLPRRLNAVSIMGEVVLDLRDSKFPPGITEIRVKAIMGAIRIIVPPGVRVESLATAIMASVTGEDIEGFTDDPHAPVIRVSGSAFMAEVKTVIKAPRRKELRG